MPKSALPIVGGILLSAACLEAGPLTEAHVTKIINDVRVVDPAKGARPALINDRIHDEVGLKTGIKSRSELLFQDDTLTRIGPETTFNFTAGTRDLSLKQGTLLLQVPKGIGGAKIHAAAVTAALTGTTILAGHTPGRQVKVLVLEGSLRLSTTNGADSIRLQAGQMLLMPPDAKRFPQPVTVDLRYVVQTSSLVKMAKKGKRYLPSADLIENEIQKQDHARDQGMLIRTDFIGSNQNAVTSLQQLRRSATHPNEPDPVLSHHFGR